MGSNTYPKPGVFCRLGKPRPQRRRRERVVIRVEQQLRTQDVERGTSLYVGGCEIGNPVVREKDLALPAPLARDPQTPPRQVDVTASETNNLVHTRAGGDHQRDGEQRRRLMRSTKDGVRIGSTCEPGRCSKPAEEKIKFVLRDHAREGARSSSEDGNAAGRIGVQGAVRNQPPAEALQPSGAASDRPRRQPVGTQPLQKPDDHVRVDLLHAQTGTDCSLKRGYIAVVRTNRMRGQVLGDHEPADVLLACLTDLHRFPRPVLWIACHPKYETCRRPVVVMPGNRQRNLGSLDDACL